MPAPRALHALRATWRRHWPLLTACTLIAAVALAQGAPLLPRWFGGPITVNGNVTATGDVTADHFHSTAAGTENGFNAPQNVHYTLNDPINTVYLDYDGTYVNVAGAPLSLGSFNLVTTGRICTTTNCATNYLVNDGAGTLDIFGPLLGTGNWSTAGDIATDGYTNPKTGIKNTGTAAACSSNTGAVCVNDTGGLAIADGAGTTVATINSSGYIASTTPHTLTSLEVNAAAAVATYGGHTLPSNRAFTVTALTGYVSSASGGGAGNTTWRVSDGTNNCDCNFPCAGGANVGSNAQGTLRCTPSGTCAFAVGKSLTVAVSTAGCTTTQPTIQNIDVEGNWQ